MEVGLLSSLPTYSGGLGVLAGDTLRAAADLSLPVVGVTLIHRKGYFHQRIDDAGRQTEAPVNWNVADELSPTPAKASVFVDGLEVRIRAWRRDIVGAGGGVVPVYFLDTDVEGNTDSHRRLTDQLYGGDHWNRLRQEVVLGVGGIRILRSLGYARMGAYHMNEGHSSLLTAELLREASLTLGVAIDSEAAAKTVRAQCLFTTHTPVPAGHDRFALDMVRSVGGEAAVFARSPFFIRDGLLDTTHAALTLSRFANAVSKRHAEVSRKMFPEFKIEGITNGVHGPTWASPPIAALLDRHTPGWRTDHQALRGAGAIPEAELWAAHQQAKKAMITRINRDVNAGLKLDAFTIGIARRATPYKRLDLILSNPGRLRHIAELHGPIQLVFSGKSHPRDGGGKELIERLHHTIHELSGAVTATFVPRYDMDLAGMMVAGCDLWLNCPQRPLEASGTSGMKAAFNGVPSLSVPDGWWLEGHEEGVTGWAIGDDHPPTGNYEQEWNQDAESLYTTLERNVLPAFRDGARWVGVMKQCIAKNASQFNTLRMVREYSERWATTNAR
ncbi:MAG: alpha-glucan family phosphorylase [Tepidisphaera sp.]|nr:alpha-glucan family phosphorylase [Tepidisphaera sp.]